MFLFRRQVLAAFLAFSVPCAALTVTAEAQPTLDSLYRAAKAAGESQVVVYGPPSSELRTELATAFSKRFPDIELVYSGMTGSQLFSKMSAERKAQVASADIVISGTSTITRNLKGAKLVQPLDAMIVLPEVLDGSKWLGGRIAYGDDERYMLAMTSLISLAVIVNRDLVKDNEVTGDQDLMNPKWKGKIVAGDPTRPGSAHYGFRRLYDLHGEEWVGRFIKEQEVVFTSNLRQLVDWVAKGRYALAVGIDPTTVNDFISRGATTINIAQNNSWKNKMTNSTGFGGLAVSSATVHPNATKLFVNWVLTQEGQLAIGKGLFYGSRRVDVDVPVVPAVMLPKPGVEYFEAYTDKFVFDPNTRKLMDYVKKLMAEKH